MLDQGIGINDLTPITLPLKEFKFTPIVRESPNGYIAFGSIKASFESHTSTDASSDTVAMGLTTAYCRSSQEAIIFIMGN